MRVYTREKITGTPTPRLSEHIRSLALDLSCSLTIHRSLFVIGWETLKVYNWLIYGIWTSTLISFQWRMQFLSNDLLNIHGFTRVPCALLVGQYLRPPKRERTEVHYDRYIVVRPTDQPVASGMKVEHVSRVRTEPPCFTFQHLQMVFMDGHVARPGVRCGIWIQTN